MRIRPFTIHFAAAGLLLATAATWAADVSSGPLEEIVVTASKREERLRDVAASVSAISGADLDMGGLNNLVDYAQRIPGLTITPLNSFWNQIVIRGQNSGGAGANVASIIDDIPFSQSTAGGDGSVDTVNLTSYDLQRIEVLRGPQGTLYGANAEAGLLKYVTNPPDPSRFAFGAELGGETVDRGSTVGSVKGFVNLPFFGGKAAIRIVGQTEDVPGYINNPVLGEKNDNHGKKYGERISILYKPIDDLSVRYTYIGQHHRFYGDGNVEVVGAALNPTSGDPNQFKIANGGALQSDHLAPNTNSGYIDAHALVVNYDLHWADLFSATSYSAYHNQFRADATNGYFRPATPLTPNTLGNIYGLIFFNEPILFYGNQENAFRKVNEELRLSSRPGNELFGHGLDWQLGYFYTKETQIFYQAYDALAQSAGPQSAPLISPTFGPLGANGLPGLYKENSEFADVTFHFNKAWDISAGGRYTSTDQDYALVAYPGLIGSGSPTTTLVQATNGVKETHTSWSSSLRWHITDDTLLYARAATGFSPGGPTARPPGTPPDFPTKFGHDSTLSREIGFRTLLDDKRISIDVAYYNINWDSIQLLTQITTSAGTYNVTGNGGTAKSAGFEWTLGWTPLNGLNLSLTGSTTNAHLTADVPSPTNAHSGDKLAYTPSLQSTFNVDYEWSAFGNYKAFVGGSAIYHGVRYTNFGDVTLGNHKELPVYTNTDFRAGLRDEHYTLELYARNAFNKFGILSYGIDSGGLNGTNGLAVITQPRTIGIRLSAGF